MNIISTGIPLPIDNIDTDQIIPAAFLKLTSKEGYGNLLFYHWRYKSETEPNPDFVLNKPAYKDGKILIAGNNFGCGSSREHAAWAIADFGIKAVISTQIADIHKENEYNNGVLPIELSPTEVDQLMQLVSKSPSATIEIDLEKQVVMAPAIDFLVEFKINSFKKKCLLAGVDATDYLIQLRPEIEQFERERI